MNMTDKEKFQKQMDFFKTHNFYQYVYQFRWLFVFIPVLGFFDLIFSDFSWLIIVKGILLMGILISEYYETVKPIKGQRLFNNQSIPPDYYVDLSMLDRNSQDITHRQELLKKIENWISFY